MICLGGVWAILKLILLVSPPKNAFKFAKPWHKTNFLFLHNQKTFFPLKRYFCRRKKGIEKSSFKQGKTWHNVFVSLCKIEKKKYFSKDKNMLDHSLLGLKWPKNEIFNISENTFLKIWNVKVIYHDEMILLFCFCSHLYSDLNRKMMTPKKLMRIYQPKFHLVRPFYLHTGPQCQKI